MKCPFELPLEKKVKEYGKGEDDNLVLVQANGKLIHTAGRDSDKGNLSNELDYIVQAINSYEKARCPCSGELEGLGYDRKEKEVVFECKKCHSQLLLPNEVWEQVLQ